MIRPAKAQELEAICALHALAFGNASEAALVRSLHTSGGARLSLVAEVEGEIVAHALWSALVTPIGWLALAPVATAVAHRSRGYASAVITHGLAKTRSGGWHGVIVLGAPSFYGRFGFCPAPDALSSDLPRPALQALGFGHAPQGRLRYAQAFEEL